MLRTRLIDRRMKTGVGRDAATRFVDFSDMPNVRLCLQNVLPADVQLAIDSNGDYQLFQFLVFLSAVFPAAMG